MTILQRAPRRPIGHWLPYYVGNSPQGLRKSKAHGIKWHDLDHGLTRNGKWRIGHGSPERVFFGRRRMRDFTSAAVDKMKYHGFRVLGPVPMYAYAHELGRNIEIEPKGHDERYTRQFYWDRLAGVAKRAYGDQWQHHFYVKVLPDHGKDFAVRVIKAASAAGFLAGPTRSWDIPQNLMPRN